MGELIGELLGGLIRFIGWFLVEILLDVVIKGTGSFVLQYVFRRKNPSDGACVAVGLVTIVCVLGAVAFVITA